MFVLYVHVSVNEVLIKFSIKACCCFWWLVLNSRLLLICGATWRCLRCFLYRLNMKVSVWTEDRLPSCVTEHHDWITGQSPTTRYYIWVWTERSFKGTQSETERFMGFLDLFWLLGCHGSEIAKLGMTAPRCTCIFDFPTHWPCWTPEA